MIRPVSCRTDGYRSYQQALDDFGITELLVKLSNYFETKESSWIYLEQRELESVAAILISQLTASLNGQLIGKYFHAVHSGHRDIISGGIKLIFPPQSIDLPFDFPNTANTPHFLYGDKLRWRSSKNHPDWGIVIGRFYSFAPHRCCWMWCYLIWLSKDSPSAAWIVTDTAWEEDLELIC